MWLATEMDVSHHHPDAERRQQADDLVALLTPIVKAACTDNGAEAAGLGIGVYGGHGYITESGVEQFARDARISQIYEGTNGVQALDLVGRKLALHQGRLARRFFHLVDAPARAEHPPEVEEFVAGLRSAFAAPAGHHHLAGGKRRRRPRAGCGGRHRLPAAVLADRVRIAVAEDGRGGRRVRGR